MSQRVAVVPHPANSGLAIVRIGKVLECFLPASLSQDVFGTATTCRASWTVGDASVVDSPHEDLVLDGTIAQFLLDAIVVSCGGIMVVLREPISASLGTRVCIRLQCSRRQRIRA